MSAALNSPWSTAHDATNRPVVLARASMFTGSKMLVAAWIIEGACILIGLTLAVAAGLEVASSPWMALSAALPFAAAAVVEAGRIPLVRGFFYARGLAWRLVALVGVLVVGCLTFENLMFGFERAFAIRIEGVRAAAETLAGADRRIADLSADAKAASARREEFQRQFVMLAEERAAADKRATDDALMAGKVGGAALGAASEEIARLDKELSAMSARHEKEMAGAWAYCKARELTPCNGLPLTRHANERKALDSRVAEVRKTGNDRAVKADAEREAARNERRVALVSIDGRMRDVQQRLDTAQRGADQAALELSTAHAQAQAASREADALRRTSQMHRLAMVMFGSASDDNASRTLGVFASISAAVLALAGSLLAAMHYRLETQGAEFSRPGRGVMARALRNTLARLRRGKLVERRIVVEKTIEVPVEVPVVRIVEKPVEVAVAIAIPVTATVAEREDIVERVMQSRATAAAAA